MKRSWPEIIDMIATKPRPTEDMFKYVVSAAGNRNFAFYEPSLLRRLAAIARRRRRRSRPTENWANNGFMMEPDGHWPRMVVHRWMSQYTILRIIARLMEKRMTGQCGIFFMT